MKLPFAPAITLMLSLSLLGCGSKNDDPQAKPTDPFLGQWKAESRHEVEYGPAGQISHDDTYVRAYRLDVTATTYTESNYADPAGTGTLNVSASRNYTRDGETLTVEGQTSATVTQLRGLTATGFTYVSTGQRAGTGPRVITIVYHR